MLWCTSVNPVIAIQHLALTASLGYTPLALKPRLRTSPQARNPHKGRAIALRSGEVFLSPNTGIVGMLNFRELPMGVPGRVQFH